MTRKFTACLQRSPAAGLTLLEVVAALAIMGTILAGVVMAKSRHTRQLALAQRQAVAVRAADELISAWWTASRGVPIGLSGTTPTAENLAWETHLVENQAIQALGARVVRVEIRDVTPGQQPSADSAAPLVAVELVVPDPQHQSPKQGAQP